MCDSSQQLQHVICSTNAAVASRRNGMQSLRTPHGVCVPQSSSQTTGTHSIVILDIALRGEKGASVRGERRGWGRRVTRRYAMQ